MSRTSNSTSSTFEPSTLRASLKPLLPIAGQFQTGLSSATTRLAPRRSHSNEKNPSHAPISRIERPCRLCGRLSRTSFVGESSRPGVVISFPRSILCHQSILLISSIKAAVGAAIETLPEMRCVTGQEEYWKAVHASTRRSRENASRQRQNGRPPMVRACITRWVSLEILGARLARVSYLAADVFLTCFVTMRCAQRNVSITHGVSPVQGPGSRSIAAALTTAESEPFVAAGAWFFLSWGTG